MLLLYIFLHTYSNYLWWKVPPAKRKRLSCLIGTKTLIDLTCSFLAFHEVTIGNHLVVHGEMIFRRRRIAIKGANFRFFSRPLEMVRLTDTGTPRRDAAASVENLWLGAIFEKINVNNLYALIIKSLHVFDHWMSFSFYTKLFSKKCKHWNMKTSYLES